MFNWRDSYISFLNLDCRPDRLSHMTQQFEKSGIKATRTRGKLPNEFDRNDPRFQVQWRRTPGSIGCMMGQMDIMVEAYKQGRSAMIFEDDCCLCSDFSDRLDYFQSFLNTKDGWSVGWLGGTIHINPPFWRTGRNPDLVGYNLGKDAEPTDDPRIIKCYSAFSTYAYLIAYEKIPEVIRLLEEVMPISMGIDWSFIKLGEQLDSYMYLPGCVKQMDGPSNIGNGMSIFSGFARLGDYWFQDRAENFDPKTIQWK
jgi:GR25 family glycosyltransferase involved in LPS biosynthesis